MKPRQVILEDKTELLQDLLERFGETIVLQEELISILITALSNFTPGNSDFSCDYCPAESYCTGAVNDSNYCLLTIILDTYNDIGASDIWKYKDKELKQALKVWMRNKDITADRLWRAYCYPHDETYTEEHEMA